MVATAKNGALTMRSPGGSRTLSLYVSDVANAFVNLDASGYAGTGSDTNYIVQNDGLITDYSQITGTADTKALSVIINGVPLGQILDYVVHVSTIANRPVLTIPIRRGDKLQLKQVS